MFSVHCCLLSSPSSLGKKNVAPVFYLLGAYFCFSFFVETDQMARTDKIEVFSALARILSVLRNFSSRCWTRTRAHKSIPSDSHKAHGNDFDIS